MSNPNFQVSDYTAFAIEQRLQRDWEIQYCKSNPLLACIRDGDLNFRKGYTVSGTKAIVPVIFSGSGLDENNIGIADGNQIPGAWPTFPGTQGFSQFEFAYGHFERSMTILSTDRKLGGGTSGARGNLIDGKTTQLMADWKIAYAQMISGGAADSRTRLVGVDYAIATANTYGGVDRTAAGAAWARGNVAAAPSPILGFPAINDLFDTLSSETGEDGAEDAPDLLMLTYPAGGVNLYSKLRELIAPNERFMHEDFQAKYGISHFDYMGMKCVKETRGAGGQVKMLNTKTWVWGGQEIPEQLEEIRIPGSSAKERRFEAYNFLGCKAPRKNGRRTGFTG